MELFLAHYLALLWLSIGAARGLVHRFTDRLLVGALLAWGNLVTTGLILSWAHRLSEPGWFFTSSLGLSAMTCLLLLRLPSAMEDAPEGKTAGSKPSIALMIGFAATIVPLFCANVAIVCTYQPNHADALTWQLPRALYYLGQNSLTHFDATDLRQTHLPFNHTLLQLPGLIYGAPLQVLSVFNLGAWILVGVGVYRLCRVASFTADASLITCWLVLTATPVIAQAVSITTELLTGAALLCAAIFGRQWQQRRQDRHAWLGCLALGLALGSSLNLFLCGLVASLFLISKGKITFNKEARKWVAPAGLALLFSTPFIVFNFAQSPAWVSAYYNFLHLLPRDSLSFSWSAFLPSVAQPSPLSILNEDSVGFGLTGLLFLGSCIYYLRQPAVSAGLLRWLILGWFLLNVILVWRGFGSLRDFVPILMMTSPAVAALIDSRRMARWIALGVAVSASWSSAIYLLRNTSRPLLPLLNAAFAPPALPSLPLLLEHHLSRQPRINIDTDGINEAVLPFLTQGRKQRFTAQRRTDPHAYNLISRASNSRNAAYLNSARQPSYALVSIPEKPTAGVEFLATLGKGDAARDYFGLEPSPGQNSPISTNRCVLVTLYYGEETSDGATSVLITVAGLNREDHARLSVSLELGDGSIDRLTSFISDGETTVVITKPFHLLAIHVNDADTEVEIGAITIPYLHSPTTEVSPIDPAQPTDINSIFVTDIVLSKDPQALSVNGLLPVEGPFPQWDLPYLRWQRQPLAQITIPSIDGFSRLRLSFSVRLHVRKKAALDVWFNNQLVQRYRIDDSTIWVDETLELRPQRGANVLEFRDAPLNNEPDWMDYLDRYPDVKKYLTTNRLPLESGAREHYELSGKAEGRILQTIEKPEPAPDGYYFMYRNIRLEGFKK